MGIASDLMDIKVVSDTIVANKVSKFCYTDTAYEDNDANGVNAYNINNEQNIPVGTPAVMKVNETVVTKGWRARASSLTRMFMNHMLGRLSYNVNKLTDMMNSLLTSFSASLGTANGIATLNSEGKLNVLSNVVDTGDSNIPVQNGTSKFTSGGAYSFFGGVTDPVEWLNRVFYWAIGKIWKQTNYTSPVNIKNAVYANGVYVMSITNLLWSDNGRHWTQATLLDENTSTFEQVCYANDIWVATNRANCWWSTDGKNWHKSTDSVSGMCVTYSDGLFTVGGSPEGNGFWWSENGKDWYRGTGGDNCYVNKIVCNNGFWVAGSSSGVWWSEDGKAWTQGTGFSTSYLVYDVLYANGLWVIGGGKANQESGSTNIGAWWSEDGKSWTQGTGSTGWAVTSLNYAKGVWVASPVTSGPWWSADGKTWVRGTVNGSTVNGTYCNMAYGNGVFITGTNTNDNEKILMSSVDGKNWLFSSTLIDVNWSGGDSCVYVGYLNGVWLANMTSHGIVYSDAFVAFDEE